MSPVADRTTNGSGAEENRRLPGMETRLALRIASALVERRKFTDRAGLTFDTSRTKASGWDRDLYFSAGYPQELKAADYRARYERGGIAERIVEAYPRGTWGGGFDVVEDPDPGQETEFERAFRALADRLDLWSRLLRADILANLGRYSVLLIGAPGLMSEELPRLSPEQVLYLTPLGEDRATIKEHEKDSESERFGLPSVYSCKLGEQHTKDVHWTRVIHLTEGSLEDDVLGKPRLRSIWNYLIDLDKLHAAGAEAAWKRMDPGIQFDLDPEAELSESEEGDLQDQIDEFQHGLRRIFRTSGLEVKPIQLQAQMFGANVETVLKLISATTGIPLRILTGSERGELASSQDRGNWADRIMERRDGFATPVVGQFLRRLIDFGALPEPSEWQVVWSEIDELSEQEKAEVAASLAEANKAQFEATGVPILTSDEIRDRVLKLGPLEEQDLSFPDEEPDDLRAAAFDLTDDPPDEPEWKAVHRAADANLEGFARFIAGAWRRAADRLPESELVQAIEAGDVVTEQRVFQALADLEDELAEALPARFLSLLQAGAEAALRSARARGGWFRATSKARAAQFSAEFDATNPRALAWAEEQSSTLIAEIAPDTVAGVQILIGEGFRERLPPRVLARRIRNAVGLRSDQSRAIFKLEAELRSAKPGTLVQRFPPREGVRASAGFRARVPEGGATDEWVDRHVARYSRMQRNYRARLIARTETIHAANEGQRELWRQAQDSGQIPQDQKRVWITTLDGRERESHNLRHGEVVGINEPWPWGTEPGEEPACRCAQGLATAEDLERAAA